MKTEFIERRKECRMPYSEKIIFTDGATSFTAYAANISRGGLFVMTLDPCPIETTGFLAFWIPGESKSMCIKSKSVHVVFDRQRCEIECGTGFQFLDISREQRATLDRFILSEQVMYRTLKGLLAEEQPDTARISACLKRAPSLATYDLLKLRYKVNRICEIFEPSHSDVSDTVAPPPRKHRTA